MEDGTTPVWMGAIAPLLGKVPKNLLKAPLLSADWSLISPEVLTSDGGVGINPPRGPFGSVSLHKKLVLVEILYQLFIFDNRKPISLSLCVMILAGRGSKLSYRL